MNRIIICTLKHGRNSICLLQCRYLTSLSAIPNTQPPKKKNFDSKDILRTLAETYPSEYFTTGRPQQHIQRKQLAKIDTMAHSAADYIFHQHPQFLQHDWIRSTTSAYQNTDTVEKKTNFDKIMNAITLRTPDVILKLLEQSGKNEDESRPSEHTLSESQIRFIFAKYTYSITNERFYSQAQNTAEKMIKTGKEMTELMKTQYGLDTTSEEIFLKVLSAMFSEKQDNFHKLLSEIGNETDDIRVLNYLLLMSNNSSGTLKCFSEYLKSGKIKPNQETFDLVLSKIAQDRQVSDKTSKFRDLLYEMSILGITPSAEFWGQVYVSLVCDQKFSRSSKVATEVFQNFVNQLNSGTKLSLATQRGLKKIYYYCNSVDETNLFFNSMKPQSLADFETRSFLVAGYVRNIIKYGNLKQCWECINKYVLSYHTSLDDTSLKYLIDRAVMEKRYDFLPVVYALAVRFRRTANKNFYSHWGYFALSSYESSGTDTKAQLTNIAKQHLTKNSLFMIRKLKFQAPELNYYIKLVLKTNDAQAIENILYHFKAQRLESVIQPVTLTECLQLAISVGDDELVKRMKRLYKTN